MTDLFSTECNSALRAGPARPPGTGRGTTRESEWRLWEPSALSGALWESKYQDLCQECPPGAPGAALSSLTARTGGTVSLSTAAVLQIQ